MFGSETLEVAIGVIFVYILFSIVCTVIREGIEALLKTRASYLERGLRELLHDREGTGLAKAFYDHPLIYGLFSGTSYQKGTQYKDSAWFAQGGNFPSYIPTKNFALTLMDLAARGPVAEKGSDGKPLQTDANSGASATVISLDSIRTNIAKLGNPYVQRVVLMALDTAQGDLTKAQATLEAWYDSSMDRVSGWYKRSTQGIIFVLGLILAIAMNVDTVSIASYLYHNDATRAAIVARAETASKDGNFTNIGYDKAKAEIKALSLPIGWDDTDFDLSGKGIWRWLKMLPGWILTALAATMGAPFWFDTLNKIMVIRSTVKPHEKSKEEASEDRQLPEDGNGGGNGNGGGGGGNGGGGNGAGMPPPDDEDHLDGCDVAINLADVTNDEDLPAATGGVAQA